MKDRIIVGCAAVIFTLLAYFVGTTVGRDNCNEENKRNANRYELRDSGIVGLSIRLDKQTGETKTVAALSGN